MRFKLKRKKYNQKGSLAWEYNPFRNLVCETDENVKSLESFDSSELHFDINHPVDIECQTSYDGSTNLILNDDLSAPKIVNSSFTVKEGNSYERITRNQGTQTNLYRENDLKEEVMLQRTSGQFLKIDLDGVYIGGELPGGNYTFLIRYSDDDQNYSRVVAESGLVSIFHGTNFEDVSGTLYHEKTNKKVSLTLRNVDKSYSKLIVSYKRDFCDTNGVKLTEYKTLTHPFDIPDNSQDELIITIDGLESTYDTSYSDIVTEWNIYDKVKTHTQNQNVLFFGNVEQHVDDIVKLQTLSLYVGVKATFGKEIGNVNSIDYSGVGGEYLNPVNVYYNLGYMPEEFYRIGIVYIYDNDSVSGVYNLRGVEFKSLNYWNISDFTPSFSDNIDINEIFIKGSTDNTKGVFKLPLENLLSSGGRFRPIMFEFMVPDAVRQELELLGIKGYFFVRQPRIPIFLTQGFSVGISKYAYTPILSSYTVDDESENEDNKYKNIEFHTTSPLNLRDSKLYVEKTQVSFKKNDTGAPKIEYRGLVSIDVSLNPRLQSIFNGESFTLKPVSDWNANITSSKIVPIKSNNFTKDEQTISRNILYIPPETSYRGYKNYIFSTKAGSSQDVLSIRSLDDDSNFKLDSHCVRGKFISYLGVIPKEGDDAVVPNTIYNIYTSEYCKDDIDISNAIRTRSFNKEEYFAISERFTLGEELGVKCGRGDCFTCTSSSKFQYNFLDSSTPLNERIVKEYYDTNGLVDKVYSEIGADKWSEFNVSDINAVDIGNTITCKYYSNFNNIRVVDQSRIDEVALHGQPRSFYPHVKDLWGVGFKIDDSLLTNGGLSSVSAAYPYYEVEQVPYIKKLFDNRIAYSHISSSESFSNGYRVFTELAYKDVERTYGAIVKLLPYGQNLFCVFEHGCGIIPINQQALLSTTTGQEIKLSGSEVVGSQVTVISQDYGSTWEESIIVTPGGIYGVDTFAKKIWRFTAKGFELISDQIVQRYLNDHITLKESDINSTVAIKNVKTHYNNYKGDVMFTFYKDNTCWNLCYSERIGKFTTRYSWTPLLSDNIQNSYVSIDRNNILPYATIAATDSIENGLRLSSDSSRELYRYDYIKENWPYIYEISNSESGELSPRYENVCKIRREFELHGFNDMFNGVEAKILSISYPKWDGEKIIIEKHLGTDCNGLYIPIANSTRKITLTEEDGSKKEYTVDQENAYTASIVGWGSKRNLVESDPDEINNRYLKDESEVDDIDEKMSSEISNFKNSYPNYVMCELGGNLGMEIKLSDFISWINIELEVTPYTFGIDEKDKKSDLEDNSDEDTDFSFGLKTTRQKGESFVQNICLVANYDYLNEAYVKLSSNSQDLDKPQYNSAEDYKNYIKECDETLRIGLYTHGRAGIHDEIDYFDENPDNQIKPTFWYNRQEPFEFEFVVNSPHGLQKVFDNLAIISNNAEPNTLEFSLVGDAYDFNKAGIFLADTTPNIRDTESGLVKTDETSFEKLRREFSKTTNKVSEIFKGLFNNDRIVYSTSIEKDPVLNEYSLKVSENCRNAASVGRRLGNIEYREDKWLVNISPIYFKKHKWDGSSLTTTSSSLQSAKLRDKWVKIRIKYTGDKLVVLSAIQTLMTISYS